MHSCQQSLKVPMPARFAEASYTPWCAHAWVITVYQCSIPEVCRTWNYHRLQVGKWESNIAKPSMAKCKHFLQKAAAEVETLDATPTGVSVLAPTALELTVSGTCRSASECQARCAVASVCCSPYCDSLLAYDSTKAWAALVC